MIENQLYFCNCCGEYVLLCGFYIKTCPIRPTDGASVIDEDLKNLKIFLEASETVLIKRSSGYEKQQRLICPNCKSLIGYHQGGKYMYIYPDSVTLFKKPIDSH
jgi:hypothetical protein